MSKDKGEEKEESPSTKHYYYKQYKEGLDGRAFCIKIINVQR
jgi:hypothetical protein